MRISYVNNIISSDLGAIGLGGAGVIGGNLAAGNVAGGALFPMLQISGT